MTPPGAALQADLHHEVVNITRLRRPTVLMVVANPAVSTTTGWPVGFWAAELFHPLHEFTRARYEVTVASPEGGRVELDAMSDPRDPSRWSADDVISMGSLHMPEIVERLERTPALRDLDTGAFDALVVCGEQGPMFQFRNHEDLKRADRPVVRGGEAYGRPVPQGVGPDRRHPPTGRTSCTAAPSPGSPTWRRTTATPPSG
jgi:hypothetical protein